jgi:hypothetical protein
MSLLCPQPSENAPMTMGHYYFLFDFKSNVIATCPQDAPGVWIWPNKPLKKSLQKLHVTFIPYYNNPYVFLDLGK